ncbi:hypothetical protein DV738_g1342, partial [Chaetothyriales sp. CBS 135597]
MCVEWHSQERRYRRSSDGSKFTKIEIPSWIDIEGKTQTPWMSRARLANEYAVLNYILERTTIPVPKPIGLEYVDDCLAITTEWVDGVPFDDLGPQIRSPSYLDNYHPAEHAGLSHSEACMIAQVYSFTQDFFRNPKFDASHDFDHVRRVVHNATVILEREKAGNPSLDTFLVLLGALLHDVEDNKYTDKSIAAARTGSPLLTMLHEYGVDRRVEPAVVKELVDGVSYSSEIKDPAAVVDLIKRIPELAVVQDADRLDAIGAIGIGRCFTFSGAKAIRSLDDSIQHFEDKLLKLQGMMKTETGRQMAAERSQRIRMFMGWWKEEQLHGGDRELKRA